MKVKIQLVDFNNFRDSLSNRRANELTHALDGNLSAIPHLVFQRDAKPVGAITDNIITADYDPGPDNNFDPLIMAFQKAGLYIQNTGQTPEGELLFQLTDDPRLDMFAPPPVPQSPYHVNSITVSYDMAPSPAKGGMGGNETSHGDNRSDTHGRATVQNDGRSHLRSDMGENATSPIDTRSDANGGTGGTASSHGAEARSYIKGGMRENTPVFADNRDTNVHAFDAAGRNVNRDAEAVTGTPGGPYHGANSSPVGPTEAIRADDPRAKGHQQDRPRTGGKPGGTNL